MRNLIRAVLLTALIMLTGLAGSASAAPPANLHCPEPSLTGHIEDASNDLVVAAGTVICVKAGPGNTGVITADGITTLRGYLFEAGIIDGSGEQGRDVSYYVVYSYPEVSPSPSSSVSPSITPSPSYGPTPTPSPTGTPVASPTATPTVPPSPQPSPTPESTPFPTPTPTLQPSPTPESTPSPTTAPVPTPRVTLPPTDAISEAEARGGDPGDLGELLLISFFIIAAMHMVSRKT